MPDLASWEAPAVFDLHVTAATHGGGTVFSDETVYAVDGYSFMPLS